MTRSSSSFRSRCSASSPGGSLASGCQGEPVGLERQVLRCNRTGEEIALHLVASELAEPVELLRCLDSFGDRSQTEVAGQVDDGADDPFVPGVGAEPLDERAVDLDEVE